MDNNQVNRYYSGIYTIINSIDNKIYVGSTTRNLNKRMREHESLLIKRKHPNSHLQSAFDRDGINSFKFEVLEECPPYLCLNLEQFWMNMLNVCNDKFGYNICTIPGNTTGRKPTEFNKQRTRESQMSRGGYFGKFNPNYGKKYSKESLLRIKETKIKNGVINSELIHCYDYKRNFIMKSIRILDFYDSINVDKADVQRCLKKEQNHSKGYIFLKESELYMLDSVINFISSKKRVMRLGKPKPYPIIECDLETGVFSEYKSMVEFKNVYKTHIGTIEKGLKINLFRKTKFIDYND